MNRGREGIEEKWQYAPFYHMDTIHFLGHRQDSSNRGVLGFCHVCRSQQILVSMGIRKLLPNRLMVFKSHLFRKFSSVCFYCAKLCFGSMKIERQVASSQKTKKKNCPFLFCQHVLFKIWAMMKKEIKWYWEFWMPFLNYIL